MPGRLTALGVQHKSEIGLHPDGDGLYLQITQSKREAGAVTRSWFYRYALHGRERRMGLGAYPAVSLADAREKASAARQVCSSGKDPIEAREEQRAAAKLAAARAITFDECAKQYIASHRTGWSNAKHRQQWSNTLETYASPVLGSKSVQAINTALVHKVLEPIWRTKPETASRVRGRIEAILDWAKVQGYREGDNPALWRGNLKHLLPSQQKNQKSNHHPALPYRDVAEFMPLLRAQPGTAGRALEFTILTAARTSETLGARWAEFDLLDKVWVVPPERMKAGEKHRVPLSLRALAILREMQSLRFGDNSGGGYVFPGSKPGRPLSNMAMGMLLRRMGHNNITVHGFRSTFRDWAAEKTNHPNHVVEMALAHAIGGKVEGAYRRGELLQKRRALMNDWERFCMRISS
jgi:integrase